MKPRLLLPAALAGAALYALVFGLCSTISFLG